MQRTRLLLPLLLLFAGTAALAMPPGAGPGPRGHGSMPSPAAMIERHADELGISPDVVDEIHALAEEHQVLHEILSAQIHDARRALGESLHEEVPDEDEVVERASTLAAIEGQLNVERVRSMLRIHRLLKPEQHQALRQIISSRRHPRMDPARFEAVRTDCADEIDRVCSEQQGFLPATLHCLRSAEIEAGGVCAAALDALPAPAGRGRFRRHHGSRGGFWNQEERR